MIIMAIGFVAIKQYAPYKMGVFILLCMYKATEAFAEIFYGIMQKNNLLYKSGQSLTIKSIGGLIVFLSVNLITHNLIISCASIVILNIIIMTIFDYFLTKGFYYY